MLIFLRSASEFERERCSSLILNGGCKEVTEILKNGSANGALDESIIAGSDLIRAAQRSIEPLASNAHVEGLFALGEVLREMFWQLRS
jgi:hypothetical protein